MLEDLTLGGEKNRKVCRVVSVFSVHVFVSKFHVQWFVVGSGASWVLQVRKWGGVSHLQKLSLCFEGMPCPRVLFFNAVVLC